MPLINDKVTCPYNEGIGCHPCEMRCGTCGWNPKVAKERLEQLHEKINIERERDKKRSHHEQPKV